jgi:ubiquinone/menaquinone biosynthesis C-methylase UbiE
MLRVARRRACTEGLANLSFVRADALRLPLRDASFDAVHCGGALHLLPDLPLAGGASGGPRR